MIVPDELVLAKHLVLLSRIVMSSESTTRQVSYNIIQSYLCGDFDKVQYDRRVDVITLKRSRKRAKERATKWFRTPNIRPSAQLCVPLKKVKNQRRRGIG